MKNKSIKYLIRNILCTELLRLSLKICPNEDKERLSLAFMSYLTGKTEAYKINVNYDNVQAFEDYLKTDGLKVIREAIKNNNSNLRQVIRSV